MYDHGTHRDNLDSRTPSAHGCLGAQRRFAHDLRRSLWHLAAFARLNASTFLRSLDALHLVTASAEGVTRIYSNDRHLHGASAGGAARHRVHE